MLGVRSNSKTKASRGFSLIELLIVVAIILIIAAIAIPNLIRAKIAANESSAANSVRKIATAEITYNSAFPAVGYAVALANLGGPAVGCNPSSATACIIDSVLSSGQKSGYQFVAVGSSVSGSGINDQFVTGSAPLQFNISGIRNFCIVMDGVLRVDPGTATPPPANSVAQCAAYPQTQ
jgi:type IV pilus assembly protein PilA